MDRWISKIDLILMERDMSQAKTSLNMSARDVFRGGGGTSLIHPSPLSTPSLNNPKRNKGKRKKERGKEKKLKDIEVK